MNIQPPQRSRPREASASSLNSKDAHPASADFGHVIFLGPTNGGKTQTLKNLFKKRVSPQNTHAQTAEVMEFGIDSLRLVDTPGLGKSIEMDAQVVASIKKFLDNDHLLRESIPNAVVIVTKFNDPGLQSPQSTFVKSLRAIDLLNRRLLSKEYCNLIILLTHFMNMRKWVRENPIPQIQIVRNTVRQHLNTSCHVVCGENDCEGWGLPRMPFGHTLPTGDVYPGNLADLINGVMRSSGYTTTLFEERRQQLLLLNAWPLVTFESSRFRKAHAVLSWANGLVGNSHLI